MRYETDINTIGQVSRTALIKKIKNCIESRHIYITAPSGYGKTVAATQWLATVRGNKTKFIPDKGDNAAGFFYKKLAVTLLRLTGRNISIPDMSISFDRLLEIIGRLPKIGKRCYFLIDDVYLIRNEEIISRIPVLLKSIPGYIRFCIVNRHEPLPVVAKSGYFEIITKKDLVFSLEEIEWLGLERGIELSEKQILELHAKTGGWVMYLLALIVGGKVPDDIILAKTPFALTSYIESRIWNGTEEHIKYILLRLAVPEQVDPELFNRLTGRGDGKEYLEQLAMEENTFLSPTGNRQDEYRFHDIFREFLLKQVKKRLRPEELRQLNDIAGNWYYEQGDCYEGARYFIFNRDHEGIVRCLSGPLHYLKETAHMSVEERINYSGQYLKDLTPEFISENAYLTIRCAIIAYQYGDTKKFLLYLDMLHERFDDIAEKQPELIQTVLFVFGLDFRITLLEHCSRFRAFDAQPNTGALILPEAAHITSLTHNLPFFHRSMRDASELHELKSDDLELIRSTYGEALGKDYAVLENTLLAGINYEQSDMIKAMHYALLAYNACGDDVHPETRFCTNMILAAVYYALGARLEACLLLDDLKDYIEREARFLTLNYKAFRLILFLREGDTKGVRQWLDVFAYRSPGRLPFYKVCMHYATMRSLLAIGDNKGAVSFGSRLQSLADDYRRPLDKIQSRLLTAFAYRRCGNSAKSAAVFKQAVEIAMLYGYTQLFVNEGRDVLPFLWQLRENKKASARTKQFADKIADAIFKRHMITSDEMNRPELSRQQLSVLSQLDAGMTYGEIADKNGISRATVKYHLLTAYKKIGVHNGKEAILKAREMGLM